VAFFKTGGVVIALFPRASFAVDTGVDVDDVEHGGFWRFSLAHNVAEEEQVDSVLAEAAEAMMVKEAQEIFFGSFFAGPDGFLWEVAWNPSFPMAPEGSNEQPTSAYPLDERHLDLRLPAERGGDTKLTDALHFGGRYGCATTARSRRATRT
jgi:hypothetical protein